MAEARERLRQQDAEVMEYCRYAVDAGYEATYVQACLLAARACWSSCRSRLVGPHTALMVCAPLLVTALMVCAHKLRMHVCMQAHRGAVPPRRVRE